jgi:hypothetical protein
MNLREAAQQALEALIWTTGSEDFSEGGKAREGALNLLFPAITALRTALAEDAMQRLTDVQQEMDCYGDGNVYRGQRSKDSQTPTLTINGMPAVEGPLSKAHRTCQESRQVEPVAYVTGYSKGYATVRPIDPCLLMCVGMALYRSPPTINEMETVEPVAWLQIGMGDHEGTVIATTTEPKTWNPAWWKFKPLYTALPQRKPLTDEEIEQLMKWPEKGTDLLAFARAIERAHGIGGEE